MSPVRGPEGTVMNSSTKLKAESIIYYYNIIKIYVWSKKKFKNYKKSWSLEHLFLSICIYKPRKPYWKDRNQHVSSGSSFSMIKLWGTFVCSL